VPKRRRNRQRPAAEVSTGQQAHDDGRGQVSPRGDDSDHGTGTRPNAPVADTAPIIPLRPNLESLSPNKSDHAGLAWQRLLLGQKSPQAPQAHHEHVRAIADIKVPQPYTDALRRWKSIIACLPGTAQRTVDASGPLAVGLGAASPIDIGCALHHTYGVPYLPGSALKGLARRVAGLSNVTADKRRELFGADDSEVAGYITFWDGWLDTETNHQSKPLRQDVITVHHRHYYESAGVTPPTDFDKPSPLPFLTVKPRAQFLISATCADPSEIGLTWAELACQLVVEGFKELGFGAKTNAGYGFGRRVGESAEN